MAFDWKSDPPALICDGESVMERIRDDDVTGVVSPVAGIAALRRIMVAKQRQIADAHPRLVTEGRDQGAIVFPRAAVKFFLDADPLVRARRRRDQMIARRNKAGGHESVAGLSTIAEGLLERDAADTAEGRLLRPSDAQIVDTTDLGFQDVVEELVRRAKLAIDK
jgi:cytidylate kinase